MDTLKTFLMPMPVAERNAFAARCGTTWPFLRNVIYGHRQPGEKLCIALERESGGIIRCEVMRPDVDWAYLRGTSPELVHIEAANDPTCEAA